VKVLLLPHRFAPLGVGGVERWAWTLAEGLVELGVDVTILTRDDRDAPPLPAFSLVPGAPAGMPSADRPRGVDVHWIVHRHQDARTPKEAWNDRRFDGPIDSLLDRLNPDVVHIAHVDGWGVVPFRRAARHGAVVGTTLHDYKAVCARGQLLPEAGPACEAAYEERCVRCVGGQLRRGPLAAALGAVLPDRSANLSPLEDRRDPGEAARRRWRSRQRGLMAALRGCDVITAPSQYVADVHRRAGLDRPIDVIRNGVSGATAAIERRPGPLRVGFFGTDVPSKGLDLLLRACPNAVELHVHGPSPGLTRPNVTWHGRYEPADAVRLMQTVDVVAMPSQWPENAPLVAAEARLAGRPLLVSDVGGLPEVLSPGAGRVLPSDDVGAWAGALERIAEDPVRAEQMASHVAPPPTVRAMAEAYRELWSAAAARSVGRCGERQLPFLPAGV
jgi:glycosyltransferase involved in cell wall biosynthesis